MNNQTARFVTARQYEASLKASSKKEVFETYCNICLGRIHCADMRDLPKAYMVEDLVVTRFGKSWRKLATL